MPRNPMDSAASPYIASDLQRLQGASIPIDIVFRQGLDVLGLQQR